MEFLIKMNSTNTTKTEPITKVGIPFVGRRATSMTAALLMAVGALATATLATSPVLATTTTGGDTTTGGGVGGATTTPGGLQIEDGTVTSISDPLPGHSMHQAAMILPPRPDGSEYTGTLTYTASKPVEVVVLQFQNLNSTEQMILNSTSANRGALLTAPLNGRTVAITLITPDYGKTPIPSASIPFTGSALLLHTLSGDPFVATYSVSYSVHQPQLVNNISNVPSGATGGGGTMGGGSSTSGGGLTAGG
jgi:hypothetical protein